MPASATRCQILSALWHTDGTTKGCLELVGKPGRRGWGRIRQLPSSRRYQASYVGPDLVRHNAPHTFTAKMDAEYWLADERRRIERDEWTPPSQRVTERKAKAVTFSEYAKTWVEQRTTRGGQPLKARTKSHYTAILDKQLKPLGKLPLPNITTEAVRTWYAPLAKSGNTTIATHSYGLLHAVLATAVADGLITVNPCTLKGAMHSERNRQPVILDVAEIAKLADTIKPNRFRALVLISAWCGLRWGEVTELRRKDIDKDCAVITVTRGVTHRERTCNIDTPKSRRGRTVVVPPHIRPDIKTHLQQHVAKDVEALLFPPARGGCHLNDKVFREHFTTALTGIGRENVRIHDLRHFAGTQTAAVASLKETMGRLGHSTVGASLIYQGIAEGRDAAIAEELSRLASRTEKGQ